MEINKSKWYIERQKKKYNKMFNSKNEFKPIFLKALKKGDLNIFREYVNEVEKIQEFEEEAWDILIDSPDYRKDLIEFSRDLGVDGLKNKYGEKFGNKIEKMISEKKLGFFDIYQLSIVNADKDKADEISELIDIFADDSIKAGIHRTGGSVSGDVINTEGLRLTGHLSSGVHNEKFEIEDLDENISFYDSPGIAISQIACGGNYKNLMGNETVDISIIAIPKEDIEKRDDIILHDGAEILNSRYIQGYVTVNAKENKILDVVPNLRFLGDKVLAETSKELEENEKIEKDKFKENLNSSTYDSNVMYDNYLIQDVKEEKQEIENKEK